MNDGPTLGQVLRGARLGWGWSDRLRAFVRCSPVAPDGVQIEVAAEVPKRSTIGAEYFVWWGSDMSADWIEQQIARKVAGGLKVRSVRGYVSWVERA